uniref:Uncharacterized protein n=1 Tax=Avena sativa TaxID=4498 RepID=A0ACD5V0W6_AVESA
MGNCLDRSHGRGAAMHYAKKKTKSAAVPVEEVEVEKSSGPTKEVKIRITRKQLEDLLRRLEQEDGGGGGAAVVSELLCMTSSCNFRHRAQAGQRTPALHSIPE